MARIKDVASIVKKWAARAGGAQGDYVEGVRGSGQDWQTGALSGAGNFAQGVQQAIADGRYEKGVSAAGAAYYVDRAVNVGGPRFAGGVTASQPNFAEGIGPVLEIARSVVAPPRGPRGAPGNMAIAAAHAEAQRKGKLARLGKL